MKDFKKLIVWQKGFSLFIDCHRICRKLPPEEKYEMGSQLRRAAFSIPSNIAEGSAKATNAHKKLFLENALVVRMKWRMLFWLSLNFIRILSQNVIFLLGFALRYRKCLML